MENTIDYLIQKIECVRVKKDNVNLKSQLGTSSFEGNYGGIRKLPYVFTEQGVAMLATVIRIKVADEFYIDNKKQEIYKISKFEKNPILWYN